MLQLFQQPTNLASSAAKYCGLRMLPNTLVVVDHQEALMSQSRVLSVYFNQRTYYRSQPLATCAYWSSSIAYVNNVMAEDGQSGSKVL